MSRVAKATVWVIVLATGVGAMVYFAMRPSADSAAMSSSTTGEPATWDAATAHYVADEHRKAEQSLEHADFTQARVILQPLLAKYPADAAGHLLLAKAMMGQGEWRQAYEEAKLSCKLDGKQAEAQMLAGVLAERFDELQAARRHYELAAELQPGSLQSTLYLANICMKLQDWTNADLYALRVLRLDPSKAVAYAITAQVAAHQGQTQRAIEQWDKAMLHTPAESPMFLPYTIQRVLMLRRLDLAGREEALNVLMSLPEKLRTGNRQVTEELAQTYLSLSRPADAADCWWRWLKDHPTDGPAAAEAGLAAQRADQTDRARQFLSIAQKLAPNHPLTDALHQALNP